MPLEAIELPRAAAARRPARWRRSSATTAASASSHALGKAYRDVVRGFRGRVRQPARPRRPPARRGRGRGGARLVRRRGRRGDPVRRRHQRRRRRRAAGRRRLRRRGHASTSARSTGCSRSTRSRARRGSRPACSARRSRTSSPSTGSPCATSRSRSSTRPSAAGSRPAPAATSRPCWTHIDDLVESVRAITPSGAWESRRLPGSGAGPSPDRMLIGSEGILGVITEAWVRVHERPAPQALGRGRLRLVRRRRRGGARARAVGAQPVQLPAARRRPRRSSPHAGDDGRATLVLGFESASRPGRRADGPGARAARATTAASPGEVARRSEAERDGGRRGRRLAPRVPRRAVPARHASSRCGVLSRHLRDRDHLGPLRGVPRDGDRDARRARRAPARRRRQGDAAASPTSTPTARRPTSRSSRPARRGSEVEQWDEIKAAVSDVADRRRRHDHPPPRGRPRPPALVRPPAPRAVRRGAARGEARTGSCGDPQPGRADRPALPNLPRPCRRSSAPCARRSGSRTCSSSRACCSRATSTRAARSATRSITFVAFCAISSAGYLFNDLRDREHDRRHPEKRDRPIASGAVAAGDRRRRSRVALAAVAIVLGFAVDAEVAALRRRSTA